MTVELLQGDALDLILAEARTPDLNKQPTRRIRLAEKAGNMQSLPPWRLFLARGGNPVKEGALDVGYVRRKLAIYCIHG